MKSNNSARRVLGSVLPLKRGPTPLALLFVVGCGPTLSFESGGSTSGGATAQTSSSAENTNTSAQGTSTTSSSSAAATLGTNAEVSSEPATVSPETTVAGTSSSSGGDTQVDSIGFIPISDGGGPSIECDQWDQDCPPGQKCTAWANDGGNSWNATKCVPVVDDPDSVGEPCTVTGSGVSGVDTCDVGAICWDVDGKTGDGTCFAFCIGSETDPVCAPNHRCSIASEAILTLCLPTCDPLLQGCGEGQGCYAIDHAFWCAPDASGPDAGDFGDPCEFINACSPGLNCHPADAVPGCESGGCCAPICDITLAGSCPDGLVCTAYYPPEDAPPGYENVGWCGGGP